MKRCFSLLGVIALLFAASCQQEMEAEKESSAADTTSGSAYDPETNTVKAQFVLSVSTEAQQATKTTADYVQYKKPFLGMEAVHLLAYSLDYTSPKHGSYMYYPFRLKDDEGKTTPEYEPIPAVRDYNLGSLFPQGAAPTRTVELSLPLGTNALLLYGKAVKTASDDLQGKVAIAGSAADITSLHFDLQPRLSSQDEFDVGAFFFANMMTYFTATGLVNEKTFWNNPTGVNDKSYGFWWPTPQVTKDPANAVIYNAADTLAKYYVSPQDQYKSSDYTKVKAEFTAGLTDGQKEALYSEISESLNNIDYTYYAGQMSWKQLGTMYDWEFDEDSDTKPGELVKTNAGVKIDLSPLGETLGYAYSALTTIQKETKQVGDSEVTYEELRAGSASAVTRIIEDLYADVERCAASEPTGWEEKIAQLLAKELLTRMQSFFKVYSDGFDFIRDANGKPDMKKLYDAIAANSAKDRWNAMSLLFDKYFYDELETEIIENGQRYFVTSASEGFPLNVGLPAGSAIMVCTCSDNQKSVDQFSYNQNIPAYGFGGTVTFPIQNYRYPAELIYYGNSPIRTSTEVKKAADYPTTVDLWDDDSSWLDGWNDLASVASDTRSVAMVNNINYGTALLESKVSFGASTLKDNREARTGETDNDIQTTYSDKEKGIFVTGILVGGQADMMGWDLTRQPLNPGNPSIVYDTETTTFKNMIFSEGEGDAAKSNMFDKIIYDRVLTTYKVGVTTDPIYTMVWDNYDATKAIDEQDDVYVGLELVNNTDDDFWGEMNLIRKGGTFYLLGRLDLKEALKKARKTDAKAFTDLNRKWDCYPPYDHDGNTINAPRVFMQDYITTANLVLGADCLKHAYVTVPDLRSSQISLGLSIDMSWTTGLEFDVEMGEN